MFVKWAVLEGPGAPPQIIRFIIILILILIIVMILTTIITMVIITITIITKMMGKWHIFQLKTHF